MSLDQTKFDALTAGVTYSAEFVPASQAPEQDGKPWECISWSVTIQRGSYALVTDYAQGIGHLPAEVQSTIRALGDRGYPGRSIAAQAYLQRVLESGKIGISMPSGDCLPGGKPLPPPVYAEVLYSRRASGDRRWRVSGACK